MSSFIKKPTCYQSHTPSCIDLIWTNRKHLFHLCNTFETGLSDHHKLISTILKSGGFKGAPIEKMCSFYKTFDVDRFQEVLKIKLENIKSKRCGDFEAVFLKELNNYAPLKKKFLRHNNNPFVAGVSQGYIYGFFHFNLFINDLIFFIQYCTLSNYADGNNVFSMGKNRDKIKNIVFSDLRLVNDRFYGNFMVLNPEKIHFISIGKNIETLSFNDLALKNSKEVEILEITLERSMGFNTHIKNICRKVGQKLSALLRISSYFDQGKKILLSKSMIKSQFNYSLLVLVYCSRQSNNLIDRIHERVLRLTYRNKTNKEFQHILRVKNEHTIHQKNLQVLLTEVCIIVNGIAPPILDLLFNFCTNIHNIRNFQETFTKNRKTVKYGIETVMYQAPFLLANLQSEYKNAKLIEEFKSKIKTWKCDFCLCWLC